MTEPHYRRCHNCGHIQHCIDRVIPEVTCRECGSNDTRAVVPPEKSNESLLRESNEELKAENQRLNDLVRRAVRGLKCVGEFHYPLTGGVDPHSLDCTLAGRVSRVFMTGMTRSIELCRRYGENPDHCERAERLSRCPSCGGHGTCSGEATGLVCGACNGTGVESEEEID